MTHCCLLIHHRVYTKAALQTQVLKRSHYLYFLYGIFEGRWRYFNHKDIQMAPSPVSLWRQSNIIINITLTASSYNQKISAGLLNTSWSPQKPRLFLPQTAATLLSKYEHTRLHHTAFHKPLIMVHIYLQGFQPFYSH